MNLRRLDDFVVLATVDADLGPGANPWVTEFKGVGL